MPRHPNRIPSNPGLPQVCLERNLADPRQRRRRDKKPRIRHTVDPKQTSRVAQDFLNFGGIETLRDGVADAMDENGLVDGEGWEGIRGFLQESYDRFMEHFHAEQ